MSTDRLFKDKSINQFNFNQEVSVVFDNMIKRSVPFYDEVNRLIIETITTLVSDRSQVIDFGCSTGHFLKELSLKSKKKNYQLIGVDNSPFMLEQAIKNIDQLHPRPKINFIESDILKYSLPNCNAVILNYVLQFIKKNNRLSLLKKIFAALKPNGYLILSEKVTLSNPKLAFHHLEYKRKNGYSELEISRKRDSLENVLIANSLNKNLTWLKKAGFNKIDILFHWVNFSTVIAKKTD